MIHNFRAYKLHQTFITLHHILTKLEISTHDLDLESLNLHLKHNSTPNPYVKIKFYWIH